MLKTFREIITKNGKKMAFGEVEDYSGSLEIVVFSDVLERHREKFLVDKVLFLRGKIDNTRSAPSFKVDDFADPAELTAKSWREIHLRLKPVFSVEEDLYDLRDAIFEAPGTCQVYFHVPLERVEAAEAEILPADCETDEDGIPLPAQAACVEGETEVVETKAVSPPRPAPEEALVRANVQISCSPADSTIEKLRMLPIVEEVWRD
jgi:hypothetical protein